MFDSTTLRDSRFHNADPPPGSRGRFRYLQSGHNLHLTASIRTAPGRYHNLIISFWRAQIHRCRWRKLTAGPLVRFCFVSSSCMAARFCRHPACRGFPPSKSFIPGVFRGKLARASGGKKHHHTRRWEAERVDQVFPLRLRFLRSVGYARLIGSG